MEDLCMEVALWELNAPPETHHQHLGEIMWEMGILMWMTWRLPFWGGWVPPEQPLWPPAPAQPDGGWEPRGQPPHPQHPFDLMKMWVPNKYTTHGFVTWHPLYQHLQWWHYARWNGVVIQAMVPWGTVCKRPLPGVSGQGKYCTLIEKDSSRHSLIYGPYC